MNIKNYQLRHAIATDRASIVHIYLLSRKRFLPYAPLAHSDDATSHWVKTVLLKQTDVWVAVVGMQPVGFMALAQRTTANWIDQLYFHPDWVGRGLGGAMIAQAKAQLGSPIRLFTFQENVGARRFYERHRFRPILFGDGSGNEEHCPDVLYEWLGD